MTSPSKRRFGRLLCRLGRHTGQAQGGTLMYTCPDCRGSFWQTHDFSAVTAEADARIAAGDHSAVDWAQDEVRRTVEGR